MIEKKKYINDTEEVVIAPDKLVGFNDANPTKIVHIDILIEAYITDATAKGLLEDTANWNASGTYIGTAITGTYIGQKHYDSSYFFEAVNDNNWIRIARI